MSGESMREMHPLFQVGDGSSTPTSPLQMVVIRINGKRARQLNRLWHSSLSKLPSKVDRVCYAADYNGKIYAVAVWQSPISMTLPQREWIELSRMAISDEAPRNTASWMLSRMLKRIKSEFPEVKKAISYQDTGKHHGTIYKASGWKSTVTSKGSNWHKSRHDGRIRDTVQVDTVRWEKDIR